MSCFLSIVALFLAIVSPAFAQDAVSNVKVQGTAQCENTTITWDGSFEPFLVRIVTEDVPPVTDKVLPIIEFQSVTDRRSLTFRQFYPEGVQIFVLVQDSQNSPSQETNYTVTQGNTDDCLIFASSDKPQVTSASNPPSNQVTPQQLPQCSQLQGNWTDGSLAHFSLVQLPDQSLLGNYPTEIEYGFDTTFLNHSILFQMPYPAGTTVKFLADSGDETFSSDINVVADGGSDQCLLANVTPTSSTTTSQSPSSTSSSIPPSGTSDTPADKGQGSSNTTRIIAATVSSVVVFFLLVGIISFVLIRRARNRRNHLTSHGPELEEAYQVNPFNQFSRFIFSNSSSSSSGGTASGSPTHSKGSRLQPVPIMTAIDSSSPLGSRGYAYGPKGRTERLTPSSSSGTSPGAGSMSRDEGGEQVQVIRHNDAGPVRVEELPPLYQDLRNENNSS